MNTSLLSEIESKALLLSRAEQLLLIERLAHHLRGEPMNLQPKDQRETNLEELSTSPLPKGALGKNLVKLAGTIDKEELELMKKAIEEGCEHVEPREW